jgi:O-phosphoseryl-tRNA(Sec) kinase
MTQFILALCGLPASGKSTLADAIQDVLNFKVEIVRTDEWRNDEYYTDWSPEKERPVRQAALDRVRELVAQGHSVIHDDTNYYASMRHELYEIALEYSFGFAIIHVATPVSVALQWNKERPDTRIPDMVIEVISKRFDIPGSRYLWDEPNYEAVMAKQNLTDIVTEIVDVLSRLEPVQRAKPQLLAGTEYDRVDTETRQIVSEFLVENPELRGNKEVSTIRRMFLREVGEMKIAPKDVREILWAELSRLL